jgi:copper chaperone CopZ
MKIFKILVLTIVALACTSVISFAQTADAAPKAKEKIKTMTVKVKGVGCEQDIKTISGNVEKLEGVTSCLITKKGATTTFKVKMNPSLVTEEAIHTAIENTAGCSNPNDRPYKVKQ